MSDRPISKPTASEVEILSVLWEMGQGTARQVEAMLGKDRTTVLKLMQIMTDKGLLVRDDDTRPQIYRPAQPAEQTQGDLLRDLVKRVFGGSSKKLLLHAVKEAGQLNPRELKEVQELLKKIKKDRA
jgi:BlaI family penicillinase repressor